MGLESHNLLLPCQNPGVRAAVWTGCRVQGTQWPEQQYLMKERPRLGDSETPVLQLTAAILQLPPVLPTAG